MILAINIVYTAQPDNVLQEVKLLKLCPPVPLLSRPWDSLGEVLHTLLTADVYCMHFYVQWESVNNHIQYPLF